MSLITQRELDLLREEQAKTLDLKVTVRRAYTVADDEPVDSDWARNRPCSVRSGWGFYKAIADRFQVVNPHIISFLWDEDIKVGDTLVLESDPGAVFFVRDVMDADSYFTLKRTLCDRQQ